MDPQPMVMWIQTHAWLKTKGHQYTIYQNEALKNLNEHTNHLGSVKSQLEQF